MAETIFHISVLVVLYICLGYRLVVALLGVALRRDVTKKPIEPFVTVVIAAYNEEDVIAATIENKLSLDYPGHRREILVVSDGSTDRTDAIVASFADRGVTLLRQEPRAGKTCALNRALSVAKGEVVVFSDANSIYSPDALRILVSNFADPEVGYVTGRMVYANPDGSSTGTGCGIYMRLENALRRLETKTGSVVGADGGIDAVRRKLYSPMRGDLLPDFVLPLRVVAAGYRVVYEPEALLCEQSLKTYSDEYRMRVRVSLRALWAIFEMRQLLSPFRNPLFAWQLWSHKVLRYLGFVFLISAYISNSLLIGEAPVYYALFLAQNIFYLGALLMPYLEVTGIGGGVLAFSRYFSLLHLAAAHAFVKFLLGKKQATWMPRGG